VGQYPGNHALGLNGIFVPEAYGGAGLGYAVYLACVREISRVCASTGIIWATNFHATKPLIDFGTEEQKRRLLPRVAEGALAALAITEPDAGSDATHMTTRFTPAGDTIVVSGGKTFITNGDVADLILVFGKWAGIDDDRKAISAVIVEKGTPGLTVLRKEDKMGHRASSTAALAFEDCVVPRANLIGRPGAGLPLLLASLNKSRPSVAAHALGIARAAFEDAVAYINQRRQSGRRIIEFQGIQFLLADLATDLAMCEAWLWHVAQLVDGGVDDFGAEASMLKMRASDLAMRITTEAVQLYGGYGYCKDYRVEQLMRDAKITQIWEGTNQIHRQIIGRSFIEKK
jgi:acyl-CoA dehydrogenase